MNQSRALGTAFLVLVFAVAVVWLSIDSHAMTDDPPVEDRPLVELLVADEITRSEMHNVLAPHFGFDRYWQVAADHRILIDQLGGAGGMVVGQATLESGQFATGHLVQAGDVLERGLIYNIGNDSIQVTILDSEDEAAGTIIVEPFVMIVSKNYFGTIAVNRDRGCSLGACIIDGQVPCCYRDDANNPICKCMANCPPGSSGGPGSSGCWTGGKGCTVECGEIGSGYEACCEELANGNSICYCRPVGGCDNNSGSGSNKCGDQTAPPLFTLIELQD